MINKYNNIKCTLLWISMNELICTYCLFSFTLLTRNLVSSLIQFGKKIPTAELIDLNWPARFITKLVGFLAWGKMQVKLKCIRQCLNSEETSWNIVEQSSTFLSHDLTLLSPFWYFCFILFNLFKVWYWRPPVFLNIVFVRTFQLRKFFTVLKSYIVRGNKM